MFRLYLILGVLLCSLFGYAQFKGHSVFGSDESERVARGAGGSGGRIYHK